MHLDDIKLVKQLNKCPVVIPPKNVRKWFSDAFRGYRNVRDLKVLKQRH